jgi:histidyl-tRNA synthetase
LLSLIVKQSFAKGILMIQRVKGTHDFISCGAYNYIVHTTKKHLSFYNFSEIQTPLIEPLELFVRALGSNTDVVGKEMFLIAQKEGADLDDQLCLRPEMTASTVRAFLNNDIQSSPWNVFSHGPVFRYERPQKGRFRQFHQFNIEMIGAQTIGYDVELITLLDRLFLHTFFLDNYYLMINFLGCSTDRIEYKTVLKNFLLSCKNDICQTCINRTDNNTLRVFDCKQEACQARYEHAPLITDHLCPQCANEWKTVQELLNLMSVSYTHNPRLVRGLDYYNGTAFEFASNALGAQSSFCGGGRYDGLVKQFEPSKSVPALGAAFGIERLALLLENKKHLFEDKQAINVLIPIESAQVPLALMYADQLRHEGTSVQLLLDGSIKQMMKKADKMEARNVLFLGSSEQEAGTVTIKNMKTGKTETIKQTAAHEYLKNNP